MDLRRLRYFVAIVEHGSFSRAATALHVAQPALSLHVRNLEADLGTSLLFRSPQGVRPTEAGEILLRNARMIIDQFAATQHEIRGHAAEPEGEVRLGLPGTISETLAVPLILATNRRFPKIRLRISEAMSGFVLDWMREGRIDLAVLYLPIEDRSLAFTPVLREALWLLGPAHGVDGVSMPRGRSASLASVARLPLILPGPGHGLRDFLDNETAARRLPLSTQFDVDSYASIKKLVELGLGYSVLPYNAVVREVEDGRLRAWEITQPALSREVHLVHAANRPVANAVSTIELLCREVLENLAGTGTWNCAQVVSEEGCARVKDQSAFP